MTEVRFHVPYEKVARHIPSRELHPNGDEYPGRYFDESIGDYMIRRARELNHADPRLPEPRRELLEEAARLITSDRNVTYGSPTQNFTNTAEIWTVQLRHKLAPGQQIEAGDVAALMIGLKLARMIAQSKRDNWADIAGYAGCGFEADLNTGRIKEEN